MRGPPPKDGGPDSPTAPPPRDQPANTPKVVDLATREPYQDRTVEAGGDGGEPPDGTNVRIAILENQVTQIQNALGEIRSDLKTLVGNVAHLPTKQDLLQNSATVVIIGLTVLAITIGGIVGGLSWLQPKASGQAAGQTPQPIVIQLPVQPSPMVPVARKP